MNQGLVFEMYGLWCECGFYKFWEVRIGTKRRDSQIGTKKDPHYLILEKVLDYANPAISIFSP